METKQTDVETKMLAISVYAVTVTHPCGHRYVGAKWNTRRAAEAHGIELLKHACSACRKS